MIVIEPIDEKRFTIDFRRNPLEFYPQGTVGQYPRTVNFTELPNITASSYRYSLKIEAGQMALFKE
jgi:hypothetical protein